MQKQQIFRNLPKSLGLIRLAHRKTIVAMIERNRPLPVEFYNRPTLEVARDLLGQSLVRRFEDGSRAEFPIHEVEAYDGFDDRASHASRGVTPRTSVMFGPPGFFYVYLCYGIHWLLNIVTGPEEYPAAILIRGAGVYSGPARLTKGLDIDGGFNRKCATGGSDLWLEDRGVRLADSEIERTPRVGVHYAGPEWAGKPYRFLWKEMAELYLPNRRRKRDLAK